MCSTFCVLYPSHVELSKIFLNLLRCSQSETIILYLMFLFYSLLKCSLHFCSFVAVPLFFLFSFKCEHLFIFICVAVLGLSWGMWDLLLWHMVCLFWHAGFSLVVMRELQSVWALQFASHGLSSFGTWDQSSQPEGSVALQPMGS